MVLFENKLECQDSAVQKINPFFVSGLQYPLVSPFIIFLNDCNYARKK